MNTLSSLTSHKGKLGFFAPCGRRRQNRGFILISSYLLLSLFLMYSGAITARTTNQQLAVDVLRDRYQALGLAKGALEELREDLFQYLIVDVYALHCHSDAVQAMQWLDQLVASPGTLDPPFQLTTNIQQATGSGTAESPRAIAFPDGTARAWILQVENPDGQTLSPRHVTMLGEATAGGVTKRIRATYELALGVSDIFNYAYFVNNYGWFSASANSSLNIYGDVRANADVDFTSSSLTATGETANLFVFGDVYAAQNPALVNPRTGATFQGLISGNPSQVATWGAYYFRKPIRARPARRIVGPDQPWIGGVERILPLGSGWDSDHPEQRRNQYQVVHDMPYLGNLGLYKSIALGYNSGAGSTLQYHNAFTGTHPVVHGVYYGPDGVRGTADDKTPLVLTGTITLDGPIVVPDTDVIIGNVYIQGRGTIYAGRNVHVIGSIWYNVAPRWPQIDRESTTGQLRDWNSGSGNLGTVCSDGRYIAPGGGSC